MASSLQNLLKISAKMHCIEKLWRLKVRTGKKVEMHPIPKQFEKHGNIPCMTRHGINCAIALVNILKGSIGCHRTTTPKAGFNLFRHVCHTFCAATKPIGHLPNNSGKTHSSQHSTWNWFEAKNKQSNDDFKLVVFSCKEQELWLNYKILPCTWQFTITFITIDIL